MPIVLPVKQIKFRSYNRDDKRDVASLAESIKTHGLLNAIVVTEIKKNQYQLIAGERRLRATVLNGQTEILCNLVKADELQQEQINLAENLQREDLTIWEEARHLEELKQLQPNARVEDLAIQIGRSAPWVAHRLQFGKLDPELRKLLQEQNWPVGHVVQLARYSPAAQFEFLKEIRRGQKQHFGDGWVKTVGGKQVPSVPSLHSFRHMLDRFERVLKEAAWKLDDATIDAQAGPCSLCPKRSSQQGLLFQEEGDDDEDKCLDPVCWESKKVSFVKLSVEKLKKDPKAKPVFLGSSYGDQVKGLPKPEESWKYSEVKALTPGARPAIYVNGREMGKQVWVISDSDRSTMRQTSRRQISQETGKPAPPSTKERLQTLTNKRLCAAVEIWRTKTLPELKPTLKLLLPVLGAVGTAGRKSYLDQSDWKDHAELVKLAEPELAQQLYQEVFPVLADRCKRIGTLDDGQKLWQEAVRQAQAFDADVDLLACWDSAIREVKFPSALKKEEVEDPYQFGHFPILGKKGKS